MEHGFHEAYWLHSLTYSLAFAIGLLKWNSPNGCKFGVQTFIDDRFDDTLELHRMVRVGTIKVLKTLEAADLEARHIVTAMGRTRTEIDAGVIDVNDWINLDGLRGR